MTDPLIQKRLQLFPVSARIVRDGVGSNLTIADCDLFQVAQEFGTPLYLYDYATLEDTLHQYRQALKLHYPSQSGITYAGKAYLCTAIAQWAKQEKLLLDCTGANELHVASHAGLHPSDLLIHGVNKSLEDLQAAFQQASIIVVDNLTELQQIIQMKRASNRVPDIWLRLRPGISVDTHPHTQTGQADSKFGMSPSEVNVAVGLCLEYHLPLNGLHFHQGSHFHDPKPVAPAMDIALDLVAHLNKELNWLPDVISPGGGWGVPYHEDDLPHDSIDSYVQFICNYLIGGCQRRGLPLPRLQLEPGRSLVARAGVALYRVGAVKQSGNLRWLLIDGGLADNPRPALYAARYTALSVANPDRPAFIPSWIAGPYCESGDILIQDLVLPEIAPGELIAVPVSGAYQLSMASNYNGATKPAVLWLQAGQAHLIQARENIDTLSIRDLPLPSQSS